MSIARMSSVLRNRGPYRQSCEVYSVYYIKVQLYVSIMMSIILKSFWPLNLKIQIRTENPRK